MIKLSNRLAAAARFAEGGVNIADIGTDHGYIPVYFAQKGGSGRLAASDIGCEPLMSAVNSARQYDVSDKIEFICADGLRGIDESFDTVIIAGMGGDNIIDILAASELIQTRRHFILQPQTRIEKLTAWLAENGIRLDDAALAQDSGKLYVILSAYSGEKAETDLPEWKKYALAPLTEKNDPLLPRYLEHLKRKLTISLSGLESGKEPDPEKLTRMKKALKEISELEARSSSNPCL